MLEHAEEITEILRSAAAATRLMLLTGAGFSSDALDVKGRPIPSGAELCEELWMLCFGEGSLDDSSLTDLFSLALSRHSDALRALLRERLTVDPKTLPPYYRTWFDRPPWRRAYTLNIDDLESAVQTRFPRSRRIRSISAMKPDERSPSPGSSSALELVHLNGTIAEAPRGVTFSTMQYARRVAQNDPWYDRLGEDLLANHFVFVGTRLEESPFWQQIDQLTTAEAEAEVARPLSLIVTPSLGRARVSLLEQLNVRWVPCCAKDFANAVLQPTFG